MSEILYPYLIVSSVVAVWLDSFVKMLMSLFVTITTYSFFIGLVVAMVRRCVSYRRRQR